MAMAAATVVEEMPKVIMCGLSKSGKSSIIKVVFDRLSAHETMFLESNKTVETVLVDRNSLLRFKILDCPSSVTFEEAEFASLPKCCALVVIIDVQQEPYTEALSLAKRVITAAYEKQPSIVVHTLIHKVDGDKFFSDDHKEEIQRLVRSKLTQELSDSELQNHPIVYHCTSIYDHTIFECFSKIVQRVIPRIKVVEECLDILAVNSRMEKAFLFDMVSKMYVAEDTQHVYAAQSAQSYELCSDMIDVVIDICSIYGSEDRTTNEWDAKSTCVIHLADTMVLYHREVDKCLALVCVLREEYFDRQHLLDYNIQLFQEALAEIVAGDA